jgi:hypothetical protein
MWPTTDYQYPPKNLRPRTRGPAAGVSNHMTTNERITAAALLILTLFGLITTLLHGLYLVLSAAALIGA